VAIVSPRDDGRVAVRLEVLRAPLNARVPLEQVEFMLRRISERYDVAEIGFDPDQFRRSAELLEQEGLPMVEIPQSVKRLSQATASLWRVVSGGLLAHDGDDELRRQVLAGSTKETTQGWRIDPTPET